MLKKYPEIKTLIIQLLRYCIVGGIAFVIDYGTLYLATEFLGFHYLLSAAIAFVLGLICNYCLSTKFVFGESRVGNKWAEFLGFAVIGIIGLGLNELIIYICTDCLGMYYMIGKIVSTVIVFLWNFFARRFILFKS